MDANKVLREGVINMMKERMYEMKPCPLCGGKPTLMSGEFFEKLKSMDDDSKACITIKCQCGLALYDYTLDERDYHVRAFLVTEKWNRRAE